MMYDFIIDTISYIYVLYIELLNVRSIDAVRFNTLLYVKNSENDYRNERLWLIDSRFQHARVYAKIAEISYSADQLS